MRPGLSHLIQMYRRGEYVYMGLSYNTYMFYRQVQHGSGYGKVRVYTNVYLFFRKNKKKRQKQKCLFRFLE